MIKVNDQIPDSGLMVLGASGAEKLDRSRLFQAKRTILIGVPIAFSKVCTEKHLPDYLEHSDKFNRLGVDSMICVSVADHLVMSAWGEQLKVKGRMIMAADYSADFVTSLGMQLDLSDLGFGMRSRRFCMFVHNTKVKYVQSEDSPPNYLNTTATKMAQFISGYSN